MYIQRKISLSRTFQIHRSSSYVQVFYHFFFVIVLLLEKRETQQISMPIRNRSNIFLTLHSVTSCYCSAHFQKWKKLWTEKVSNGDQRLPLPGLSYVATFLLNRVKNNQWKIRLKSNRLTSPPPPPSPSLTQPISSIMSNCSCISSHKCKA